MELINFVLIAIALICALVSAGLALVCMWVAYWVLVHE